LTGTDNILIHGRCVLVVEDEYIVAEDLAQSLKDLGAEVVGPAGSVADALALVASLPRLDGAILDLNLGNERAFPIADALRARRVPFVFATGYGSDSIPEAYREVPRCEKPVEPAALSRLLFSTLK
jgi:CheY-like chemotaxis protein